MKAGQEERLEAHTQGRITCMHTATLGGISCIAYTWQLSTSHFPPKIQRRYRGSGNQHVRKFTARLKEVLYEGIRTCHLQTHAPDI